MVPTSVLKKIRSSSEAYVARLREFVAIQSESANPAYRKESKRAAEWLMEWLTSMGAKTELHELPHYDGVVPNPIVTARIGNDATKKTILVYGHYDVQPAVMEDGWRTDPFTLTDSDSEGYMYGRGAIDDKGQVCSVLQALQAYVDTKEVLPVNLVFVIEGMEESGSEGLEDFLLKHQSTLFLDVSSVLICDTDWLGERTPTVIHALRGLNYFQVTVKGPKDDLHSGSLGGPAWEPLSDLVHLFSRLREGPAGKILIPGFEENLMPVSDEFRSRVNKSGLDAKEYKEKNGLPGLAIGESLDEIIVATAFRPSLTIHGFGKVFAGPGSKTVIPGTAVGYMSTRLVPFQDPKLLAQNTKEYLEQEFAKLGSPNTLTVELLSSGNWWYMEPEGKEITVALHALEEAFGVPAVPMAEGGSIPVAHSFSEMGLPVVLLSLGKAYGNAHGPNERHHIDCLTKGAEAVTRYWEGVAAL